jgi:hypothetical protein
MMVHILGYLRSEVLAAVKMSILVFWVVTLCALVGDFEEHW